ncbi:hypothetical protein EPA93_40495 [Ktedonosporobacter rubrisoli]|uniref:Putative zinc-finger domain-containing protein n=1 Tax=Ktedonosporobacter rubrisoli TaxID=2509675 RepID=A0A4P6K1P1_KTERU|nr:anti-sigma factor [Ktedonosporobacter rubrisoli]QBD81925.1 hypothetical protein EPA93_40495 [Ktedonosporobacter rubrisoli]
MSCEQVKGLLSAYLDKQLALEDCRNVTIHLQECVECKQTLADFRHLDALLASFPRVGPDATLRKRIFSSPEYLEITGTLAARTKGETVPYKRVQTSDWNRPQLVSLPGGRLHASTASPTVPLLTAVSYPSRSHGSRGLRAIRFTLAAAVLLALGVGGLISWNLWHPQGQLSTNTHSIIPPAGLSQPLVPAGTRFVFQRDNALWSAPTDGGTGIVRLTPTNVVVATTWTVRPALTGRSAGNMLAYIDLQQGFVHTVRSDGQNDTLIQPSLFKSGTQPSSMWDTALGATILSGLSWAKNGSQLAFLADAQGNGQTGLYIYSTGTGETYRVPLPFQGSVAHPVWSPDSTRVAFVFTHDNQVGILDYNTQNHGILTIVSAVNSAEHPNDTVLTLDWSTSADTPSLTWSVGTAKHIHSIWQERVGLDKSAPEKRLIEGSFIEATYNSSCHAGAGSWLLITEQGDILRLDASTTTRLGRNKSARSAQWSPDGSYVDYFETPALDMGMLHLLNTQTGSDTLIAPSVTDNPAPTWSVNSQNLIYATSTHILIVNVQSNKTSQPLKLQGVASTFSWSLTTPGQVALSMADGQQGIYLLDTQHDTAIQLDTDSLQGPIMWTQVP